LYDIKMELEGIGWKRNEWVMWLRIEKSVELF
jgi:hypothetical protein